LIYLVEALHRRLDDVGDLFLDFLGGRPRVVGDDQRVLDGELGVFEPR